MSKPGRQPIKRGGLFLSPPADAPEKEAEENGAAGIYAKRVAEFIGAAGVIGRINGNIVAEQQVRKGAGHQRPLDHAADEPSRRCAPGKRGGHVPDEKSDTGGDQQKTEDPL